MKYAGAHVIKSVRFTHGRPSSEAPVSCTCGSVVPVADYSAHIRANGQAALPSDRPHRTERSGRFVGSKGPGALGLLTRERE